jgi:hypothetical protein
MTQWFFTEVHLLASKLVPVVAIHSLVGSRANRHHTPNLQPGAAQPTQDKDLQATSNPLEYLLALYRGKVKNPSQLPRLEPETITFLHSTILAAPKSSRWRQPPRVTSESRNETQSPSASRCNHSKQCTWMLSNLTKWWINQARWVREEWLGCNTPSVTSSVSTRLRPKRN